MNRHLSKAAKILVVAVIISSMMVTTVFGAAMTSTNTEKFRTAVVSQLDLENGATANVVRGKQTVEMYQGMRLGSGDHLVTTGSATVYIMIDQDKILRMDGDSEAALTDTLLGGKVKIELVKGSMFFNVVDKLPDDQSMEFNYENITISVRGTSSLMKITGGALGVAMADGTVEVTRKLPEGSKDANGQPVREESFPVTAGQKFEYTEGLAEDGSQAVSKITNFTLKELPESIVEEMMKDAQLKERVVASVPESIGPGGAKYADPATVNLGSIGKSDEKAMEPSEEIKKNDPEIVKEEQEKQAAAAQEDDTVYVKCPACGETVSEYALEHDHFICECGHRACEDGSHVLINCGGEGHYYCKIAEEEWAGHVKADCGHCTADIAAEPEKHEKCVCCGEYVCNGEDHTRLACEEHYACEVAAEDVSKHTKSACGHCETDVAAEPEKHEKCSCCDKYVCNGEDHTKLACKAHCKCQLEDEDDEWKHVLLNSTYGCKHEVLDILADNAWKLHIPAVYANTKTDVCDVSDICQLNEDCEFSCDSCGQVYMADAEGIAAFQANCMNYKNGHFYCIKSNEEIPYKYVNEMAALIYGQLGEELFTKMVNSLGFGDYKAECGHSLVEVARDCTIHVTGQGGLWMCQNHTCSYCKQEFDYTGYVNHFAECKHCPVEVADDKEAGNEWLHEYPTTDKNMTSVCLHDYKTIISDFRSHMTLVAGPSANLNYISACYSSSDYEIKCPGCGEIMTKKEWLSSTTHFQYDKTAKTFKCNNVAAESESFYAAVSFMIKGMGTENFLKLLERSGISIDGSNLPIDCSYCGDNGKNITVEQYRSGHAICTVCGNHLCNGKDHNVCSHCSGHLCTPSDAYHSAYDCGLHYHCETDQASATHEKGVDDYWKCQTITCPGCNTVCTYDEYVEGHKLLPCGHHQCEVETGEDHSYCSACKGYKCDGKTHTTYACGTHYQCDTSQSGKDHRTYCDQCNSYVCDGNNHTEKTYACGLTHYQCVVGNNEWQHYTCSNCSPSTGQLAHYTCNLARNWYTFIKGDVGAGSQKCLMGYLTSSNTYTCPACGGSGTSVEFVGTSHTHCVVSNGKITCNGTELTSAQYSSLKDAMDSWFGTGMGDKIFEANNITISSTGTAGLLQLAACAMPAAVASPSDATRNTAEESSTDHSAGSTPIIPAAVSSAPALVPGVETGEESGREE